MPAQKTESAIDAQRIAYLKRTRFNPMRGLDPMRLSRYLDAWRLGRIKNFALCAHDIGERDDVLSSVIPKRKKKPGHYGWEVLTSENGDEKAAARHAEVLEAFYNNIRCENAWEPEERGGWAMLCRQMLDSVGMKRAVHEIVWRPRPGDLRATFRFVPLWFFEMETGSLRYLQNDNDVAGIPLEDGEWMVTTGDGLMVASSILYMFKSMPLRDWVSYTEKFGFPLPHLGINASPDSTEWRAASAALAGIINDSAFLYNNNGGASFGVETFGGAGQLPFEKLIDRSDRRLAAIWRGADLSTISQTDGVGSENQKDETDILELDDAMAIEEALEHYVSRHVIEWYFGTGVEPLAYIKLKTDAKKDTKAEQEKLDKAIDKGIAVATRDYRETLELPTPQPGDDLVGGGRFVSDETEKPVEEIPADSSAANAVQPEAWERYIADGEYDIGAALQTAHADLLDRLAAARDAQDAEELRSILEEIAASLDEDFAAAMEPLTQTFERLEGTALVEGAIQGQIARS
ncbi:MAG: hypothetical protein CML13_15810 [Puniceicoccaceae bacterium]|nr:hypothetical protein [Puniceicoccaceae bacterium]|tara:strand:- start:4483 stop:6036 length:1554 start_codon:yes stop_codon:yes gene_type:complete